MAIQSHIRVLFLYRRTSYSSQIRRPAHSSCGKYLVQTSILLQLLSDNLPFLGFYHAMYFASYPLERSQTLPHTTSNILTGRSIMIPSIPSSSFI